MAYNSDGYGNYYYSAPLFSTPLVNYQGTAAGDAVDGDNARTIRDTMGVVSVYRSGTAQVGTPASITVPASSTTGIYAVSWGSSSTTSVTYVLEEATNSSFSSGLRTAYSGASTSTTITGRSNGTTYYYRVKATKSGYTDSDWKTGSNGCAVTSVCPCPDNGEITNVAYPAGEPCTCSNATSLAIGTNVTIQSGADVTFTSDVSITIGDLTIPDGSTVNFIAPVVNVEPGFHAANGANVTIRQP